MKLHFLCLVVLLVMKVLLSPVCHESFSTCHQSQSSVLLVIASCLWSFVYCNHELSLVLLAIVSHFYSWRSSYAIISPPRHLDLFLKPVCHQSLSLILFAILNFSGHSCNRVLLLVLVVTLS